MPDPITTLTAGGLVAYLGKDAVQKMLGPTAAYLGDGMKDIAEKRLSNIARVFENARKKLGARIETPGEVPPRVLKAIVDDASFNDTVIATEYFGGILASSRTSAGRDDRGARIVKILDGLSSYQIRAHYLIYASISNLFRGADIALSPDERNKMQLFFPILPFFHAMEFDTQELQRGTVLVHHILYGLFGEDLISPGWRVGRQDYLKTVYPDAPGPGFVVDPSAAGAELFLWGFGLGDLEGKSILNADFVPCIEGVDVSLACAQATHSPAPA